MNTPASGGGKPAAPHPRKRIYALAAGVPMLALMVLLFPGRERLRAAGPANTGHAELTCAQCHTPADGTVRQQVQANLRHLLGSRATPADFLHKPVGNVDCVACHQNDDDRHPTYRFNEPRFADVRAELAPQNCVSCHTEHTGRRVTAQATVCSSCHADMEIREDPIQPTHSKLVEGKQWATCLSCHDFHGNHVRDTPRILAKALGSTQVEAYLAGGAKIYGEDVRFPARTERIDR
ncbi:MAG: cytochrome c3 family protein [Gemmatimonadetes bacterium]|nr:cytochrome c3 family protein [Gemmatimonadota bacterium]